MLHSVGIGSIVDSAADGASVARVDGGISDNLASEFSAKTGLVPKVANIAELSKSDFNN